MNMTIDQVHKFERPVKMTYEEHFQRVFKNNVSLIRELESRVGKAEMHAILLDWSNRRGVEMAQDIQAGSFEEFKHRFKQTAESEYYSNVSTVDFPTDTETELACHFSECLYAKTFRDLEAEDLGYIMLCHPDFAMAEAINPKLQLERSKTLMQGHDCCNHKYVWRD
jgi:hypothetical protein